MDDREQPSFSHAEPVLAVYNVTGTIKYWQEVLGFPNQWTWGDPPTHGGVSWHGASIQFSHDPALAALRHGHSIWIRVRNIERLYEIHQENKAEITMPLSKQVYGLTEYVVKDNNGYYITFAAPTNYKKGHSEKLPDNVRILVKKPTVVQYRNLFEAVGWSNKATDAMLQAQLDFMQTVIIAENENTGDVIGCALLLGDGFSFYYVKDVMVHPDWQGKRVGTAIMQELSRWLDKNAANKAMVTLFSSEHLAPFYQQVHFSPTFGMMRIIDRDHQPMP
ncbi:GNAT family N-acetyltransferase [Dyadobacter sp. LJ53]|uniref:GNAT family N-acetyltransferase n=1 Tax=Dyadobacter chenwenxiniae TaxID=2906456 RepID=UPI001F48859F|nr:GNAT family N-acetyltransferase [Dyadobacter chenwenxiniae]MCF0051736.1 GNAT family N-acetyltransferase [Dyadobacter chenwenxiniae]